MYAACKCFVFLFCHVDDAFHFHISSKKPFKTIVNLKKRSKTSAAPSADEEEEEKEKDTVEEKLPKTNRTIYNFTFYYWFNFLLRFFLQFSHNS